MTTRCTRGSHRLQFRASLRAACWWQPEPGVLAAQRELLPQPRNFCANSQVLGVALYSQRGGQKKSVLMEVGGFAQVLLLDARWTSHCSPLRWRRSVSDSAFNAQRLRVFQECANWTSILPCPVSANHLPRGLGIDARHSQACSPRSTQTWTRRPARCSSTEIRGISTTFCSTCALAAWSFQHRHSRLMGCSMSECFSESQPWCSGWHCTNSPCSVVQCAPQG